LTGERSLDQAPLIADAVEESFAAELDAVVAAGAAEGASIPALPASALSSAIMDRDGAIIWRQDRFAALVGADTNDLSVARTSLGDNGIGISHGRTREGKAVCLVVAIPSVTKRWPITLPPDVLGRAGSSARVAVAVALSDQTEALAAATRAFGFTALETRVAVALVQSGGLPEAARRCNIAYETAREAIESARRKAGVSRQPALVARITAVAGQVGEDDAEADRVLVDTFGLTPREARLALALMRTGSRQEAARAAGVSTAVAKKQYAKIFEALGARSASDVSRMVLDAIAAALLVGAANQELPPSPHPREPLRLIPRADGGMIAISDYGPERGRPLLLTHSGSATRLVPRSFVAHLQLKGWRPLAIDRPGFGLTSLRGDTADPWLAACKDMLDALDALGLARIDILARGGVYAVAMLARLHPERVIRIVALNPDVSTRESHKRTGAIGLLWRAGERNPQGYEAVVRWLATHTTPDRLASLQRVLLRRSPIDLAALAEPQEQEDLRRSVGLFAAGRLEGAIREHHEHSRGVDCPPLDDGANWRVIMGAHDLMHAVDDMKAFWRARLPGCQFGTIEDGGRFLHLTHPHAVLAALDATAASPGEKPL
jgi:pimeloyl-ACP methyl ester carboxylesterase/DNA-binding CsgD family transcriptional regulator